MNALKQMITGLWDSLWYTASGSVLVSPVVSCYHSAIVWHTPGQCCMIKPLKHTVMNILHLSLMYACHKYHLKVMPFIEIWFFIGMGLYDERVLKSLRKSMRSTSHGSDGLPWHCPVSGGWTWHLPGTLSTVSNAKNKTVGKSMNKCTKTL